MGLRKYLSAINRRRKSYFSKYYVSAKRYIGLQEKYENLLDWLVGDDSNRNSEPTVRVLKAASGDYSGKELCLFVSYSKNPRVKPHVDYHLNCFLKAGVDVVLIVNSDNMDDGWSWVDSDKLAGLYLRENVGFDFGAWSQVLRINPAWWRADRIYMVNDSIVGPFSYSGFEKIVSDIRGSKEDFIGLTCNNMPRYHIQSFFLVLGRRLLENEDFRKYFSRLLNFPEKQHVIDGYETRLTQLVRCLGFMDKVIFDRCSGGEYEKDSTIFSAKALVERGFPYVKVSLLSSQIGKEILVNQNFKNYD